MHVNLCLGGLPLLKVVGVDVAVTGVLLALATGVALAAVARVVERVF